MPSWAWLNALESRRGERATAATTERLARSLAPNAAPNAEGVYRVPYQPRHGYHVTLHLWPERREVMLLAASDLMVERDWLPRELLLVLLEGQSPGDIGKFWLHATGSQRQLLLWERIDPLALPADELKVRAESLVLRLQQLLTQLYARELILRRE